MNSYLIPANSKKSQLILGFLNYLDLGILSIGLMFTIIMLLTIQTSKLSTMLFIITPALITCFLVLPIPNYHNSLQLIMNIFIYFCNRRKYIWKGWCINETSED